ncbi:prepilin peptidase [Sphingomonas sp.]|uniref:A24 family peptidase n=1 Tax=Sphingomonas sp. TaxID=28214 RepID=UPI00286C90AF|nr:prepilin peptidase [Sphingomonas sp.]
MNLAATAPSWLLLLFVALLVAAAAEDAWRLRISNLTCLFILVAAIAAAMLAGPRLALWQNAATFVILLALGTPIFAAGKLGGGDVKLIAACGAWFDLRSGVTMLINVLLAGGILALVVLTIRAFRRRGDDRRDTKTSRGIPYGVAIACGTLLMLR